jgi:hypothetical protein
MELDEARRRCYITTLSPEKKARMRAFIAALRSGRYRQTTGTLNRLYKADESVGRTRAIRKYCCLGVACEVAIKDGLNLQKTTLEHVRSNTTAYNDASGELPVEVAKFYGIPTNPLLVCETSSGRYEVAHATTANDSLKLSFREIADAFERTYRLNETSD